MMENWKVLIGEEEDEQLLPLFSKRIKTISISLPGIDKDLTFKDLYTRNIKSFHFGDEPYRKNQRKAAQQTKSKIIATIMCLIVEEKIQKDGL